MADIPPCLHMCLMRVCQPHLPLICISLLMGMYQLYHLLFMYCVWLGWGYASCILLIHVLSSMRVHQLLLPLVRISHLMEVSQGHHHLLYEYLIQWEWDPTSISSHSCFAFYEGVLATSTPSGLHMAFNEGVLLLPPLIRISRLTRVYQPLLPLVCISLSTRVGQVLPHPLVCILCLRRVGQALPHPLVCISCLRRVG